MNSDKTIPPKLAEQFLNWFCKDELLEEILGDLHEYHEELSEKPNWKRHLLFWFHVLNFLRPFALKKSNSTNTNSYTMFRHNFIISFRNFNRYRTSFVINLVGLSTGLACALLIYLWVNDELQVDKFHENDSQIYQVLENFDEPIGMRTGETTSGYMPGSLAEEMPEVEYGAAVLDNIKEVTLSTGDKNLKAYGEYVSKDFFKIFSYPIIRGNKDLVWAHSNSIMLSESLAQKLFNTTEDIIGKTVELEHDKQFAVSGIFENLPKNSTRQFEFTLSFEELAAEDEELLSWRSTLVYAYVKLKQGVDIDAFNEKIRDYVQIKRNEEVRFRTPFLVVYSDQYLYGQYENGVQSGGRIEYVRLFSGIAVFILIIACINFMNLSTAKASRRMKEVGIKKATGASRKSLIFQYLGESTLMVFLSLGVAIILVLLLLPQFNQLTGKHLVLYSGTNLIFMGIGIVLFTGLASGIYPTFYLSGFNPVAILKGTLSNMTGATWARKGLVVFQFVISVILIVSVLVIYKQIEFVQSKNLGYSKDNIILFDKEGKTAKEEHTETFISELKKIPGIVNASSTGHDLTGKNWGVYGFNWEGKDPDDNTHFEMMTVYYDVVEMLGMELIGGRTFSEAYAEEDSKVIFNQAAIEHMGLQDPVGKTIKFWGRDKQIIGVVKNFHFESLRESVKPLMISFWPGATEWIIARIESGKEKKTLERLEEFYHEFNPGFSLDYKFLDQDYQAQYVAEQRVATLSRYFAGLAIVISCLGLFGLAAFTAERRTKEIGIRKILGASTFVIVRLLSGDFTRMVLSAIVIALPVSYFIATRWLESFAYRIDIKWWFFAGAGLAALLIAWFTVSIQTMKAARINPTECLKDE